MNPHHGTVDHLNVAVIGLGNRIHDAVPHPGLGPAVEAIVASRIRSIAFRQIAPRRARAQHPENAAQDATVVNTRNATWLVRKKRFNDRPFKVREVISPPM